MQVGGSWTWSRPATTGSGYWSTRRRPPLHYRAGNTTVAAGIAGTATALTDDDERQRKSPREHAAYPENFRVRSGSALTTDQQSRCRASHRNCCGRGAG